jgi:Fe-S cluster biosynthesis and repair protein YggX
MSVESLVFCKKFNKELPSLPSAPLLGNIGQIILKNCSSDAWNEWLEVQIKIINEERLDLSEKPAKERLYNAMINFLNIADLLDGDNY